MKVSRSKSTVVSYLVLALFGVVASWLSWFNQDFRVEYSVPAVFATLMLFWIRNNPTYYAQPFYRNAWRLNTLLLWLTALPGLLLKFPTLVGAS
ncbi:MAG: hypothetical protein KJ930_12535 [Gammaproteobacteria bacterium]|nr:hypothetical protein [Gammaproteobacteria bacterium]MBU2180247.1 hypothetical protein [Gammaproteobacteria bacterium]MBU2224154.1 hypothetical protein [Gammaproteobacteria bacterium]MBU2277461.1 hypothetical protein [Gammaproteobacteria bacterium]MBU2427254.1 hypothetical protein [Gammaproteobacteria bacterium]